MTMALAPVSLRSIAELFAAVLAMLAGWISYRRNAIRYNQREQQLVAVIAERTEAVKAEKERVQDVSRFKSQFLINVNHELRTPMNGIVGALELALKTDLNEEQREYLELSMGSAEALMAILEEILEFSRNELDTLEIQRVDFTLGRCVQDAVATVASAAKQKGVRLRTEIARGLPERVCGDPTRLHQVLTRILDNAVKFSSRGEVAVSVRRESTAGTEPQPEDGALRLLFCIKDTGIGIPEDKREEVFEPFRQVDGGLTRNFGGMGLGLTICKRLVRILGGRIWVESEVGQGSRFYFTANFKAARQIAPNPMAGALFPSGAGRPTRAQLLVVEDNRVNQLIAVRLLEKRGYYCLVAGTGREALTILAAASINLVLMDVQMPDMDGYEATRCIRELEKKTGSHIPILATTAQASAEDRESCLLAGMDGHIAKPFQSERLYAAIDTLLEQSASRELARRDEAYLSRPAISI